MTSHRSSRRARGVSLIEALVALAVMAFGMLGVVGMQTTLRSSADLSRQRAEAVRLAQEEIERVRNYSALRASDAAPGQLAFEEIDDVAAAAVAASATNTTFTRATEVAASSASEPWTRHVRVSVGWVDRRDQPQTVELSTVVSGFPLQMAALPGLRTDRGPLQQPLGRNPNIPRGAVDEGDGTSRFVPPGGPSDRSWIFNNTTGLITRICQPATTCTASNRWLLSGIVAFATGDEPTAAEAASPGDAAFAMSIRVVLTLPAVPDEACTTELTSTRVNYFCAVPLTAALRWSGRVAFSGFTRSSTVADNDPARYKVCRYTLDDRNWMGAARPTTETAEFYNNRHPYRYLLNTTPQLNKNFLVISAGDGTAAFGCPDEDTSTLIETNTWPHDPPS
jgi:Tfp pilus assembly protein PilV